MKFKKMVKTQNLNFTVTTQFCVHVSALLIMWESVIHRCGLFFLQNDVNSFCFKSNFFRDSSMCISFSLRIVYRWFLVWLILGLNFKHSSKNNKFSHWTVTNRTRRVSVRVAKRSLCERGMQKKESMKYTREKIETFERVEEIWVSR